MNQPIKSYPDASIVVVEGDPPPDVCLSRLSSLPESSRSPSSSAKRKRECWSAEEESTAKKMEGMVGSRFCDASDDEEYEVTKLEAQHECER